VDNHTYSQFSPDGLDLHAINALIADVDTELEYAALPTSALLDGSAAERRARRIANRAVGAVVRALPGRRLVPDGPEAAG
jgi:hypothetical protein